MVPPPPYWSVGRRRDSTQPSRSGCAGPRSSPARATPQRTGAPAARAARRALGMAGMTIDDIGVLEVHDASAPAELMLYEELGLCAEGEGGRLIDEGVTEISGRLPGNTSGGPVTNGDPGGG